MQRLHGYILAAAFLALCPQASAQRLVVSTQTLSALGQAVRVYAHTLDMNRAVIIPGPIRLPGAASRGPILLTQRGTRAIFAVAPSPDGGENNSLSRRSEVTVCDVAPFRTVRGGRISQTGDWRIQGIVLGYRPSWDIDQLGLLLAGSAENGQPPGRLDVYQCAPPGDSLFRARPFSWPLPGIPVSALSINGGETAAILCKNALKSETFLHVRRMFSGEEILSSKYFALQEGQFGSIPAGFALSRDGAYLFVLTSGYALAQPSGERASWLHVVDTVQFEETAPPLLLQGTAAIEDGALQPGDENTCWIATHSPGTDFAYATCVRIENGVPEVVAHRPFTGVSRPLHIAPAPKGPAVAIAAENRLEIWPDGQPATPFETFPAPIGALIWPQEGLFLGEGGRVHKIDTATRKPVKTVQIQTGFVSQILAVPSSKLPQPDEDADGLTDAQEKARNTSPESPDTDGDGIPDGVDPEPTRPSPQLVLPDTIRFHGEAIGHEVRSILLNPAYGNGLAWRLEYDRNKMPWLAIHPQQGTLPYAPIHMGVIPARFDASPGETVAGQLTIHVAGTQEGKAAAGSPARIEVQVAPDRNALRRVLWIWGEEESNVSIRGPSDPFRLGALAELLAAAPHYFTHREVWGPLTDALQPFTVVVLGTDAAAQGAMTRQALLDYVADGGALLLLGAFNSQAESETLASWLSPVGIHITSSTLVEGVFATDSPHELCRHWHEFRIRQGCAIRVEQEAEQEDSVLVPGPEDSEYSIFSQFSYGLGRIAVLASPSPLETRALENKANRQFAADLFRWLARARQEISDQDGDGLPDAAEGRRTGLEVDPSKTDHLNADSDGDGIPDSLEDLNRNGRVDEGETSPLNPDSDGDGIFDGADAFPLPPADAPHVASVEGPMGPAEGPSEGGTRVIVGGRNFGPDSVVWFGERRSPSVRQLDSNRLMAVTPPYEPRQGGTVTVRTVNRASRLEGSLPSGFRYTPRSVVRVTLRTLETIRRQYLLYEGSLALRLDCPAVEAGHATLTLNVQPAEAVKLLKVVPSPSASRGMRSVVGTLMAPGLLRIDISPGKGGRGIGEIASIEWAATATSDLPALKFFVESPVVTARNGTPLDIVAPPLTVSLQGRITQVNPRLFD